MTVDPSAEDPLKERAVWRRRDVLWSGFSDAAVVRASRDTAVVAEVGVLGPVVFVDHERRSVKLGGEKPRAVLAYLAIHAGRVVAVPSLIDAVWGDDPPNTAVNTLQVHVSSLRRALSPSNVAIDRTGGGYRLDVPTSCIDAHRFEAAVAEGRAALRSGQPNRAHELLSNALALWRGRPFEGLDDIPFVEAARPAIENGWASASVELIECLVELGCFDEAIVEAEQFVALSPFDERAWAMAMVGYYWAGRASDALRAFQRARQILADELGLEPGPDLVALERAVLGHTMPRPGRGTPQEEPHARATSGLPNERRLIGREHLVEQISDRLLSGSRLVSLTGLGGIGKTSVAITVGHRLAASHVAVWFVDLSAAADAAAAADAIARTVGAEPTIDPAESLIAWSNGMVGVVILDNLEQVEDAEHLVTTLLDRTTSIQLLVTSRRPVRVRDEQLITIPPLSVRGSEGTDDDAAVLFRARAELVRPDLHEIDDGVVTEICDLAAGIPLGIELAALQLRALTPTQLLRRLHDFQSSTLDAPSTADYPERQRSLRAVLESTMAMLTDGGRDTLARLSLVEGPVTVGLLERCVSGAGIDALVHVADLVEAGLVVRLDGDRLQVPTPVRRYTQELLEPADRSAAEDDLFGAVDDIVNDAECHWHGPHEELHRSRLRSDAAAIDATVVGRTRRCEWVAVAELALRLAPYWLQESRLVDALSTLDALCTAELPPELAGRVRLLTGTFASYINRGDTADLLERALLESATASARPDRLVVNGWCCLGAFYAHRHAVDDVRRCTAHATEAAAASADPTLVALARDFAGYAASYLGDTETAIRLTLEGIDDARRQGDLPALALLLATVTEALLQADRVDEAHILISEAFDLARRVDLGSALTWVLLMVGATQIEIGRPAAAWGSLVEHLRFTRERYPDPLVVGDSLAHIAAAQASMGDDEASARTWGASVAIHADHGVDPDRRRLRTIQRRWDATRERLGAPRFDALVVAGSADPERVIDALIAVTAEPSPKG